MRDPLTAHVQKKAGEGMSISNEKMLGEQILVKIDCLIESLVAAQLRNPQDARQNFNEGCQLVAQLFDLLGQFIGPHPEYVETAVKELVNQRIPDRGLLNEFDGFNAILDEMCQHVESGDLAMCQNGHDADAARVVNKETVERALDLLFPRETVRKRHRYKGVYFDYYLPSLKIAVEESGDQKAENAVKEFLCRRDGIRVATVNNSLSGYREIARQIKRQLEQVALV
jgi:hypothetical protein